MDEGHTKYTPGKGTFEIRDAICEKLSRDNSIKYNPDQIIVSSGAKHSLSTLFQAILNPNDEVIIFSPFWVPGDIDNLVSLSKVGISKLSPKIA